MMGGTTKAELGDCASADASGLLRLRFRQADTGYLAIDDTGRFFKTTQDFAARWAAGRLTAPESQGAHERGFLPYSGDALTEVARMRAAALRAIAPAELDYLILVPTLRCNLSCSYCQVSRADENSVRHDWTAETLSAVLALIGRMTARAVKIEFQGGEPTLRPDLMRAVMDACARFESATFVICTNLSRLDPEILALFDRPDVHISTSLDGALDTHERLRTISAGATDAFASNLDTVLQRYGPDKISALPTLDPNNPPDIEDLIDAFESRGLNSIFLRPINFQGFARKRHATARERSGRWYEYHEGFVRALIARNWADRSRVLEESYLSLCLRRIFQPGHDRHVDLRNPNPAGVDYVVIDHDGAAYPTDEARMLTRSGVIDLRIGDVASGWQTEARELLSAHADNRHDTTCNACAYQPYCGRDVVDDLARYGRIDMPRQETEFCRRHTHMFDLAFRLIYDPDPAVQHSVHRWLRLRGDSGELGPVL